MLHYNGNGLVNLKVGHWSCVHTTGQHH